MLTGIGGPNDPLKGAVIGYKRIVTLPDLQGLGICTLGLPTQADVVSQVCYSLSCATVAIS
jgi:hypothetical protein